MKVQKAIEYLIFPKSVKDKEIKKEISKVLEKTIDIEKLKGKFQSKYSFRLNDKKRVICEITLHEGEIALVVSKVLLNHKYNHCRHGDKIDPRDFKDTKNWTIVEKPLVKLAERKDEIVALGDAKWSVQYEMISMLDAQQLAILKEDPDRPIVMVTGVAGSGKTLIATLLIEQELGKNSNILYVTQSEHLVELVKKQCRQAGLDAAVIKTFRGLCAPIIIEQLLNDKSVCNKIGKDSLEFLRSKALAILNGDKISREENKDLAKYLCDHICGEAAFINRKSNKNINARHLYQDICKLHNNNNDVEKLRRKLFHSIEVVEDELTEYRNYLKDKNYIDLSLIKLCEKSNTQYDCIVLDEAQDLVGKLYEFRYLLNENGRTYFFLDTNQSTEADLNPVHNEIKELAADQKKGIKEYQLKRGYRNPQKIIELANRTLQCIRVLVGGVLFPSGLTEIEAVEGAIPGCVEWLDGNMKDSDLAVQCQTLLKQNPSTLAMVIVVPEGVEKDIAKKLFPQRMIFTPREIKGLEFPTIVLLNFFNKKLYRLPKATVDQLTHVDWSNEDKKHNRPKTLENAAYQGPSIQVFVSITRATRKIYIVQEEKDQVSDLFKHSIFSGILGKNQTNGSPSSDASIEKLCFYVTEHAYELSLENRLVLGEDIISKAGPDIHSSSVSAIRKLRSLLVIDKSIDNQLTNRVTSLINRIDGILNRTTTNQSNAPHQQNPTIANGPPSFRQQANVQLQNDKVAEAKVIHDFHNKPIGELLTKEQLTQKIQEKTGLHLLLVLRKCKEILEAFPAFFNAITRAALNYSDATGCSALLVLVSFEEQREILDNLVKLGKDFRDKISNEALLKIGPGGLQPITYLHAFQPEFVATFYKNKITSTINCPSKLAQKFIQKKSTLLHITVQLGNYKRAHSLLKNNKFDIEQADKDGFTALHYAAIAGKIEIVKYLIKDKNSNTHPYCKQQLTPFDWAIRYGRLNVVRFFVEDQGEKFWQSDKKNRKPLHVSVSEGHLPIVKYLLAVYMEKNLSDTSAVEDMQRCFPAAIACGKLDIVEYFIKENIFDVNQFVLSTAFHNAFGEALIYKELHVVHYLIDYLQKNKQNLDNKYLDDYGRTFLHCAASAPGAIDIIRYFIEEQKLDVMQQDERGYTALHYAAYAGDLASVQYLTKKIKTATNNNVCCEGEESPFELAINKGHLDIVKFFVDKKGSDIHKVTANGLTPLLLARLSNSLDVFNYLREKGADVHAHNSACGNDTTLTLVKQRVSPKIASYLNNCAHKTPSGLRLSHSMSGLQDGTNNMPHSHDRYTIRVGQSPGSASYSHICYP